MADQRIFFEQGSDETGDSGERGSNAVGVDSIKPVDDGERAEKSVFNRPTENIRLRTEALRTAGEEAKYLLDSNTKWIISAGNADGLSPGPLDMPGISAWDAVGGTFTTSAAIVVQPINTPGSDKQETKTYSFTDGLSQTGAIEFTPLSDANPFSSGVVQKRDYNGANLIRIKWEKVEPSALATAVVPNYCDIAISGDPEHILTITVRNDDTTQISNVQTALESIETAAGQLGDIGLGYVVTGTVATAILYDDIDTADVDYRLKGTFEREIHYIPSATFVNFFATPNSLSDGDTLSIHFDSLTTADDSAAQPTGRRESVPSNNTTSFSDTTTVAASQLFITSSADDVYKIPLSIPLCKRIGDDLYWMDGTVVKGTQTSFPVYFGEHGNTATRLDDLLASDANVTGDWLFEGILSLGAGRPGGATGTHLLFSDTATTAVTVSDLRTVYNTYTVNHNVTGDVQNYYSDLSIGSSVNGNVAGVYNKLAVGDTVSDTSIGVHTIVTCNEDPGDKLLGSFTTVTVSDTGGGEIVDEIYAHSSYTQFEGLAANTQATVGGGLKTEVAIAGGTVDSVYGYYAYFPLVAGGDAAVVGTELSGFRADIITPSTAAIDNLYGVKATVTPYAASSGVYGAYLNASPTQSTGDLNGCYLTVQNSAAVTGSVAGLTGSLYIIGDVGGSLKGLNSAVVAGSGAAVSDIAAGVYATTTITGGSFASYGVYSSLNNTASTGDVIGVRTSATNSGSADTVWGVKNNTTNNAVVSYVYGVQNTVSNTNIADDVVGLETAVTSSGDVSSRAVGVSTAVTISAEHPGGVFAAYESLTVTNTGSSTAAEVYLSEGVATFNGTTTATQITSGGGEHVKLNLRGGAFTNCDGLFIDIPTQVGGTASTVSTLSGLRIETVQPSTVTATLAYGAYIDFDNTNGPTGDGNASGLHVQTEATPRGVDFYIENSQFYGQYLYTLGTPTALMIDTVDANTPLNVGPGDGSARSIIYRSLTVDGSTFAPSSDKVSLNIEGAFKTAKADRAWGTSSVNVANLSYIRMTGTPGGTNLTTMSGAVDGQWLFVFNFSSSTGTITTGGNIILAGASSITLDQYDSALFVYDGSEGFNKWCLLKYGA